MSMEFSRDSVVRYHVALVTTLVADLESELNYYADRGWRVVAVDGNRVFFEETRRPIETQIPSVGGELVEEPIDYSKARPHPRRPTETTRSEARDD